MNILKILSFVLAVGTFASCQIEESAVPKPITKPGVENNELAMGNDYRYQLFFDFETNSVVAKNEKTSWDLGFECGANGFHVILNESKSMFAYNTHRTNFENLTDTVGLLGSKLWDEPSGNLDSTAVGNWKGKNEVYIIDRGFNASAERLEFKKIQFLTVDANSYTLKMANIDGSNFVQRTISKDDLYNFVFLSLTDAQMVSVEPPKNDWDVSFTQYIHIFDEDGVLIPYLVAGCLLNPHNTSALTDSISTFDDISLSTIDPGKLSSAINTIGYGWKAFNGTTYRVNKLINYVVKNRNNKFFKIHFISFYNTSGEKGSPSFEFQLL